MVSPDRTDTQQRRHVWKQLSVHLGKGSRQQCKVSPGSQTVLCAQVQELLLPNAWLVGTAAFLSPDLPSYFLTISDQEAGQREAAPSRLPHRRSQPENPANSSLFVSFADFGKFIGQEGVSHLQCHDESPYCVCVWGTCVYAFVCVRAHGREGTCVYAFVYVRAHGGGGTCVYAFVCVRTHVDRHLPQILSIFRDLQHGSLIKPSLSFS